MKLTEATIANRYVVWALVIAAGIFGAMSYVTIPMQLFPDTAPPLVNVITAYPGASADDISENLSQKLEEEFAALEGVAKIRATSQDNMSMLSVEFHYDRSADLAAVDVQNAIARIRGDLPMGIVEPQVLKFSTADRPVISIGVTAKDKTRARKMTEDQFAPELQRVAGVAGVDVFGGAKPAVLVEVDLRSANAYGLSVARVVEAIRKNNTALPAGEIRTESSHKMFRLECRVHDLDELRRVPIALSDGSRVLLGDVAKVESGALDDTAVFAVNGHDAIAMQVFKTEDANTVKVVRAVRATLKRLEQAHPEYSFAIGEESATFTQVSVDNLLSNVWQALLFASIIIFLFLGRLSTSAVTIVSMPLSYGMTFALMRLFDVEFNMVTLSAVILAVGMVVDGAVVILENIVRRREQDGLSPERAAIEGTDEVMMAVLGGVATTLVVLLPLLFLNGFTGKTFGPLALTLIFAFAASVVVAVVLVPVLTLYTTGTSWIDSFGLSITRPFTWLMTNMRNGYVAILKIALRHRAVTILLVVAMFAGSVLGLRMQGMETMPKMDGGSYYVTLETPSGTSLAETRRVVSEVEAVIREDSDVVAVLSQVGFEQGQRSFSSFGAQGPTQGSITVTLTDRTQRLETIWEKEATVRDRISRIPGIRVSTVRDLGNSAKATTTAPIMVTLTGDDHLVLDRIGTDVVGKLGQVPNVVEPTRNWRLDLKRMIVTTDSLRLAELGLAPDVVAATMASGSFGAYAGDFHALIGSPDPISVRFNEPDGEDGADPLDFPLFAPGLDEPIPLRAVARAEERVGQGVVTRENLKPTLEVSAFAQGRSLNFVIADVDAVLADIIMPVGYELRLTGEKSDMSEANRELLGAIAVALLAVYLLLVAQLRSFLHPLTIMLSIPLSLIGVVVALKIAGKPVSMPVMVGLILLVGTVVNNAIILYEFIHQKIASGSSRRTALIGSVETRFRPIMMTSLSTIVGMIPLSAEWALGAERFSPLATTVIGGMTAATFLTMVFIPVFYDVIESASERVHRVFTKKDMKT